MTVQFRSYILHRNHYLLDPDLATILRRYWPAFPDHEEDLVRFGEVAGGPAYQVAADVDQRAQPILIMHDVDGRRVDRASLSPAHHQLLKDMAWINRPPYQGSSWHHHYALGYLLADPGLYCSLIVTNQTAYAIHKYATEHTEWKEALLAGEMWGATWMTETHGGSDLGANLTVAREEEGTWRLYGDHKYFASNAGLADLALVTARPEGAAPGPKGLALFLVPRQDREGNLNFIIRRFKNKTATRAVPTGEVEFHGSEAYLVGREEWGIYYTLENLTVSRLANAMGAVGLARKAHLEALFRSRARTAFGKPIVQHPLLRYDLTDMAVRVAGSLALAFHAVDAFDKAWHETPPYSLSYHYARFLSHLAKNRTAEHAAEVTRLGMEVFGGLGFLEEFPLARLHREALVTAIWEGTSNIQALDMLEAMQKKAAHEPFLDEFIPLLERAGTEEARAARARLEQTMSALVTLAPEVAQWRGKEVLRALADAAIVGLLYALADEGGERYAQMATLYARHFLLGEPYPDWAVTWEGITEIGG